MVVTAILLSHLAVGLAKSASELAETVWEWWRDSRDGREGES
jgi:hypothetical protein